MGQGGMKTFLLRSLARLGDQLQLVKALDALGVKCTRLDLAADFSKQALNLDDVATAAARAEVCGFRRYTPHAPVRDMRTGEREGTMHAFGRRGGDGVPNPSRRLEMIVTSGVIGEAQSLRTVRSSSPNSAQNDASSASSSACRRNTRTPCCA